MNKKILCGGLPYVMMALCLMIIPGAVAKATDIPPNAMGTRLSRNRYNREVL